MTHDSNPLENKKAEPQTGESLRVDTHNLSEQQLEIEKKQFEFSSKGLAISEEQLRLKSKFLELAKQKHELDWIRHSEKSQHRKEERESRQRDKEMEWKRQRLQVVYMPLIVLLLTAILGTGLSFYLQDRSFRQNELFKARLEQINRQRNDMVVLLLDVEEAWRQVRSDEKLIAQELEAARSTRPAEVDRASSYYCSQIKQSAGFEVLRKSRGRSLALIDQSGSFGNGNDVVKALVEFNDQLRTFLECSNNGECKRCTSESDNLLQPLKNGIAAYGILESHLIAGKN